MKRYLKYIFLSLVSAVLAVSCLEELEPTPSMAQTDDITVLVPRVKSFTNQYVTKAGYSDEEDVITSLKVLVFNNDGALVHTQDMPADTRSLTLNKSMLNSPDHKGKLSNATVVMLANIDLSVLKKADGTPVQSSLTSLTLDDLANSTYYPEKNIILSSELGTGFKGFPMIGGVSVDLTPTSATNQQDPVVIDLKILFAKIEFEINVEQGSENQGEGMQFTLNSWAVNNVSRATTLAVPTNNGEPVRDFMGNIPDEENVATADEATASSEYTTTAKSGSLPETKTTTLNGTPLKFTFYMAESRYNPGTYTYPINDLHESFKQQFKPEVATTQGGSPAVGMASYVQINGAYIDYRGTSWNVNYKIYLGKNSYDNFHVDRNSHYKNVISIKGIRDRQQGAYSEGAGDVWIDHRVNVAYNGTGADDHVTITRETLIDSHIEVRPLRVKWGKDSKGNDLYTLARVYLPYYQDNGTTWTQRDESSSQKKNWIGIELGDKTGSLYCSGDDNPSKGKRKYFTETLVSELNDIKENTDIVTGEGDKFIALSNNQCAWIYIDEYWHDESTATNPAANDREAKVIVDFCTIENNAIKVKNREEYILSQQPLIKIDGGKYYLENYEEYLYSYDSQDRYSIETSPTDYTGQGLKWGYTEEGTERVSKSQFVTKTVIAGWAPTNNEAYDLLHQKDKAELGGEWKVVDKDGNSIDLSSNNGYNFTYNVSANNGVYISRMDKMPESAYQYCLSKNKFKEGTDGEDNQMLIRWYVPDVYELSDIFQDESSPLFEDSYYWSSQVPYAQVTNNLIGTIASEVESQARAVSKDKGIENRERIEKHRIRCLYNRNGKTANMENRTPEGIGGLIKIPMTVANNGFFNYTPWFTNLGVVETHYSNTTYRYPMGDTYPVGNTDRDEADKDFSAKVISGTHYYTKNPLALETWAGRLREFSKDYYTLIHDDKWPGLTSNVTKPITDSKTLEQIANLLGISSICTLTETPKSISRSVTNRSGSKIDALPSNVNEVYLDHNGETENNLKISFALGTNNSKSPTYKYYNEDGASAVQQVWDKFWNPPTYLESPIKGDVETFTGSKTTKTLANTARVLKENELKDQGYTIESSKTIEGGKWYLDYPQSYYEIKAYINISGYRYLASGYWDANETPRSPEPVTVDPEFPNVDALTFYAGNTFTISCAKEDYYIRSIKVNYNSSTITEGTEYLRFVDNSKGLPDENKEPEQMTYLDGANGWSKWTSKGDDTEVTLRLVIYEQNRHLLNWWNPDMVHKDPTSSSDRNRSLIINSLEIRLEEKR